MSALKKLDLANEYLAWLKDNLMNAKRGAADILVTPFLDPFNDGIEIHAERSGEQWVLHDAGKTYENLLDLGVQIEKSERRQAIIEHAIAGCAVQWRDGRLETVASSHSLAQRAHFLITAISRMNDLWMSSAPRTLGDFFALVKEYLDEQNTHYSTHVTIPGRTVDHPIDFLISLGKGKDRMVKLIGSPSLQAAKLTSFTWIELKETRPQSERIVVVNDTSFPDSFSEESEESVRHISQPASAILNAYSTAVLPWTARNDASFLQKLVANG
jgi:hypothetical protein